MNTIGYARVSSTDQNLTVQRDRLTQAGCAIVLEEKISGTTRDNREQLQLALKLLRPGDTLVVTRLDRLGRSLKDLADIAHEIQTKGAHLRATDQSINTSASEGRLFFGILAAVAEFETAIRRDRQREGIDRAKRNGERRDDGSLKYAGGIPTIDRNAVVASILAGQTPTQIAKAMGISRVSVYRIKKEMPSC